MSADGDTVREALDALHGTARLAWKDDALAALARLEAAAALAESENHAAILAAEGWEKAELRAVAAEAQRDALAEALSHSYSTLLALATKLTEWSQKCESAPELEGVLTRYEINLNQVSHAASAALARAALAEAGLE